MIKLLSGRFCKSLGRFHMLGVKACSETALFREWSNQDFHSRIKMEKRNKSALIEISQLFESGLTMIFTLCNFGYTLAVTIIICFKEFKI